MTTGDVVDVDAAGAYRTLRELRATRQRKRLVRLEWFEIAYKVYVAAIVVIGAVVLLSNLIGDDVLTGAQQVDVRTYTPAVVGLATALAIGLGLRSGARGGPLSVEAADVHHVLLAPLDRRRVLLRPAGQQLRRAAFVGAAAGAVAGQLLARRVADPLVPWALAAGVAGATIGVAFVAAGLIAHAAHLARWQASGVAAILVGWQGAALPADSNVPGPFDTVGSLVLWPMRVHAVDLVAPLAAVVAAALGLVGLRRVSLDALARRSALVSQLRFAVTVRDLRTVVLLRRQLSNEQHRVRPWVRVPSSSRAPVLVRGARSLARFPASRLVRMALLTATAAAAQVVAYRGTTPAIVVSGLAAFVLGLECLEPFAQELDQPDRSDLVPHPRGWLLVRHLPAPAIAATLFGLLGGAGVAAALRTRRAVELAAVICLPVVLAGLAGAVLNTLSGIPEPVTPGSVNELLPPEVAGMREVFRTVRPLVVAMVGSLPVLAAREAAGAGDSPLPAALQVTVAVGLVVAAVAWWARRREEVRAKFATLWAAGDAEFKARQESKARKELP